MKKYISITLFIIFFISCTKDRVRNVNPFLPDYSFSYPINLNLPSFVALKSNINPMYINAQGVGIRGIIVIRISDSEYRAWEAACPNQSVSDCSTMKIVGLDAKCDCDGFKYSLFTGVGGGQYTMKPYQVEILNADNIRVYN